MHDVGLTHVALPVTDLSRSADFYGRYARMRVVHRRKGVLWLSDHTRPFAIVLIESDEVEDPLRPAAHLGVACESREALETLVAHAQAEQCLVAGPEDAGPPVGYWTLLRDPDGHTLELSHGQEVALAVDDDG